MPGACELLSKRDLNLRDDDIDDQDEIPLFNPQQLNITGTPLWPTPKGLKEKDVREICTKKIRYSEAGKSCGNVTGVDIDTLVEQCVSDIQVCARIYFEEYLIFVKVVDTGCPKMKRLLYTYKQ